MGFKTGRNRLAQLSLLISALLAGQALAAPMPTGPDSGDHQLSPFYDWAAPLPAKPGQMLRSERTPLQPELKAAAAGWRILYSSSDYRWNAGITPVSGTFYVPRGTRPAKGWPLVAWAHGTLGISDVCSPSWGGHKGRDAYYINRWLAAGYAVVATDYQGLGGPGPHPYLIWQSEGRSILDGIRAVLASRAGTIANRVVITGQSQGSGAALGATRIAPRYAPEIKLQATIATGIISRFPDGPVQSDPATITPGFSPFMILQMLGGSMADDAPALDTMLTPAGREVVAAARNGCNPEMRKIAVRDHLDQQALFTIPLTEAVAKVRPVSDMPMERIKTPLFLGTGLADTSIPPHHQYAAAAAICAAGNPAEWHTYPGVTHNGIVNAAFDDELRFVTSVAAGGKVAGNCASLVAPGAPQTQLRTDTPFND